MADAAGVDWIAAHNMDDGMKGDTMCAKNESRRRLSHCAAVPSRMGNGDGQLLCMRIVRSFPFLRIRLQGVDLLCQRLCSRFLTSVPTVPVLCECCRRILHAPPTSVNADTRMRSCVPSCCTSPTPAAHLRSVCGSIVHSFPFRLSLVLAFGWASHTAVCLLCRRLTVAASSFVLPPSKCNS